ncbi:MAG TPA: BREX system ATP-binding domain-containing protein [Polyangia bacterium]|nr:BREX system ATP-binding domain-containing protein [Polyangia bacterium]
MTPKSSTTDAPGELTPRLARKILNQMGENGKPPELGVSHVNVGNETYLHLIEKVYIEDLVQKADGSSFKLVQGTYGAGKTHFLFCVRDLAWHRNLLSAFVTISPKECALTKPLTVYQAVARTIELARQSEDDDPVRGLDDILRLRAEQTLAQDGRDQARRWIDASLGRAPIDRHSFRQALVRYLHAVMEGAEDASRRLAAWLRGEAVPLEEAKLDGVYEAPSNENGFAMLRSLVQAAHRLGYAGSLLLFDEGERRLSLEATRSRSTSDAIDQLRELVDLCGRSELPRTLILYAVTPAFTQEILPVYPALQQRLGSPIQYLSPHNPKAPLIDLEALDLDPPRLLEAVGERLAHVARVAYDFAPPKRVVTGNLQKLVSTVTEEQLEVSHRRLFVKTWIRLLDDLRIGGLRVLAPDEIEGLVRDEQMHLLVEDEAERSNERLTFFGNPLKPSRTRGKTSEEK